MDTIKFTVEKFVSSEPFPLPASFPAINIYINGQNLLNLTYEVEQMNWARLGYPRITGFGSSYAGLPVSRPHVLEGFLGSAEEPWAFVLGCICAAPACWGLIANIKATPETMQWSRLKNPWLASPQDSQPAFDYSALGPFVFDRQQYERALMEIKD